MDTESHSSGNNFDVSPCMKTGDCGRVCAAIPAASAIAFKPGQSEAAGGTFVTKEFTPTMQAQNNGSTAVPAVAFKPSHYTRGKDGAPSEVTAPLSADADKGDQDTVIALGTDLYNGAIDGDISHSVRVGNGNAMGGVPSAMVYTKAKRAQPNKDDESWVPGEVAPTQNQFDVGDTRATTVVAFTQNSRDEVRQINGDGQVAGALSAEQGMHQTNYVAAHEAPVQVQWASGGGKVENPTMQALRTSAEHNYQFVRHAMQVRRLTPRECCRLQGFPDDRCDITFRKKPAADGPKYCALGNSMAVPCMWWLGHRISLATRQDTE